MYGGFFSLLSGAVPGADSENKLCVYGGEGTQAVGVCEGGLQEWGGSVGGGGLRGEHPHLHVLLDTQTPSTLIYILIE